MAGNGKMLNARAEITGLKELRAAIQDLTVKQQRTARRVGLRAAATVIRNEARRLVAVRSGALKKEIDLRVKVLKNAEGAEIGYHKSAFWGLFNELGTSKMRAQPFLRPALAAKQQAALEKLASAFKAMVAKYRGRK